VATSALGTGIDYPDIVYVLHVGVLYGIIDFAQESGRAGRDGAAVDLVIVAAEEEAERAKDAGQSVDELVMRAFVYLKSCQQAIISSYLNRCRVKCSMRDCAACDQCGEGVAEWHRWQQREGCERDHVCSVLDELTDGCAAC
jgi:superfamily II DNA helicase RecQ